MATMYFLYSSDQIVEKNNILKKLNKRFVPGVVTVGNKRVKFTQLSSEPTMGRFADAKVVAKGELNTFTYVAPTDEFLR